MALIPPNMVRLGLSGTISISGRAYLRLHALGDGGSGHCLGPPYFERRA